MSTIELNYPITHDGKQITGVTFRRAKIKDIEAIEKAVESGGEIAASITSISRLADLPEDVVREIDGDDFVRIAGAMSDFLPNAKTGEAGDN